jgi:hypothetical protein
MLRHHQRQPTLARTVATGIGTAITTTATGAIVITGRITGATDTLPVITVTTDRAIMAADPA